MSAGKGDTPRPLSVSRDAFAAAYERTFRKPARPEVAVDREGDPSCRHLAWKNEAYNDWGLPYYVATCVECGRRVSSPSVDVYEQLTSGAGRT